MGKNSHCGIGVAYDSKIGGTYIHILNSIRRLSSVSVYVLYVPCVAMKWLLVILRGVMSTLYAVPKTCLRYR